MPTRASFALACVLACVTPADANPIAPNPAAAATVRAGLAPDASRKGPVRKTPSAGAEEKSPPAPGDSRAGAPVEVATGPAREHGGYVHYFLLEFPDGNRETMVGIEMPDRRIAWSFPELGVVVSPFIASGEVHANGRTYGIQHLYGLRPFPADADMRALQKEIEKRVIPWVDDETPYCNPTVNPRYLCTSCLGFVLRILFPGRTPAYPALPSGFQRTGDDPYYTTEDLLLYLTGLSALTTPQARSRRIEELALPPVLRDDLLQLVAAMPAETAVAAATTAPQNVSGKSRPRAKAYSKAGQPRPGPGKKSSGG